MIVEPALALEQSSLICVRSRKWAREVSAFGVFVIPLGGGPFWEGLGFCGNGVSGGLFRDRLNLAGGGVEKGSSRQSLLASDEVSLLSLRCSGRMGCSGSTH